MASLPTAFESLDEIVAPDSSASTAAVAIHEVGHLLGLDHHDGGDCAMDTKHRAPYLCKRCAERVLERLRAE